MKRFSKFMLSVAAVSAVTAAMAVSASALTAEYDNGTVTLGDVTATGTSQTVLVLNEVNLQTVAAENIKQIDQKDDGTSFAALTVGALADGTYEVRIGGDGQIQKTTFTVGDIKPPVTHEVLIGDVNEDGKVTSADATTVLVVVSDEDEDSLSADAKIAAQKCNGLEDTKISAADATEILIYVADEDHDIVNTKVTVND